MATRHNGLLSLVRHPSLPGLEAVRGEGVAADIVRHAHVRLVVGLCLSGGRRLVSGGGQWNVPAGEGFIIPAGVPHACGPAGAAGHSYLVLAADTGLLKPVSEAGDTDATGVRTWCDGVASGLLVRLVEAVFRGEAQAVALFRELAAVLDLCRGALSGLHPATRLVKVTIDAAPDRPVSLAAMAGLAGVSPFHLERLFVRDLGVPLGAYALSRRVHLAAGRIGAGEPLAEAALAAGFYDQSHLARHFRRHMGVSPGRYHRETPAGR